VAIAEQLPDELTRIVTPRLTRYIPHTPHPKQQAFLLMTHVPEVLFGGAAGGGKALSLSTPVPTLHGWTTIGAIMPGDVVFDEAGRPTRVVAVSEVMHNRPCFEVCFSDGSKIIADAEHRWHTMTAKERSAAVRRTPEWREHRRARRASRSTGKRPDLIQANREREYECLPPPTGDARTTATIAASLRVGGRVNHSVAVGGALQCPKADLPIAPYALGVWLGDGTATSSAITTADEEIVEQLRSLGYEVVKHKCDDYGYCVRGLIAQLRALGLNGNKHIPGVYLRASVEQRLALLQGLMDTDGTADTRGQCEFYTTNRRLADDVHELIVSLGIKAAIGIGHATLNGKDCGPKYRIKFMTALPVFRLPRKADRQKRDGFRGTHNRRYIVDVRPVESEPVKCIQVEAASGQFLCGENMVPTHNSDSLLMAALQYVDVPGYNALLLRRTYAQLSLSGGLLDRSQQWLAGTDATWHDQLKTWHFPSGARVMFGYLESKNDRYRYLGTAYQFIGFDELTQFPMEDYLFLFSRLQRLEGVNVPLRMRAATNPGGPGHNWVRARFVDGSPAYDESGRLIRTFIPSLVEDNPSIDAEAYLQSLAQLDPVTHQQLRWGDWDVTPEAGMFRRADLQIVDRIPAGELENAAIVRFWDLAATEPDEHLHSDPDWTRGVKLARTQAGYYYVLDVRGCRQGPGGVEQLLRRTAEEDGREVPIYIEQEPGQSGRAQVSYLARHALAGFEVHGMRVSGSKEVRARPMAAQAALGHVKLLRGAWNTEFLDEVCAFPTEGVHDDQVDALSGAYHALTRTQGQGGTHTQAAIPAREMRQQRTGQESLGGQRVVTARAFRRRR